MKVEDAYKLFDLQHSGPLYVDTLRFSRCVDVYSEDWSWKNAHTKIWNAICHLFGQSDWQLAIKVLESRIFPLIPSYFWNGDRNQEIIKQTHAVSEYVLRYFTTQKSLEKKQSQYLIPKESWTQDITEITIDAVMYRAALGNGTTLPELSREKVIELMKVECERAQASLHNYTGDDKSANHLADSCNRLTKLISGAELPGSKSTASALFMFLHPIQALKRDFAELSQVRSTSRAKGTR